MGQFGETLFMSVDLALLAANTMYNHYSACLACSFTTEGVLL